MGPRTETLGAPEDTSILLIASINWLSLVQGKSRPVQVK